MSDQKKQIEEIAKHCCFPCDMECHGDCLEGKDPCKCYISLEVAKNLYNAGYRKQIEGEWEDKPTGAYGRMQSWCSACGKHSGVGGIESNRHKPFCPNCGAKMKGGGHE